MKLHRAAPIGLTAAVLCVATSSSPDSIAVAKVPVLSAIRGTVRSGGQGQLPLRRARVQLDGTSLARSIITVTDDAGRFVFEGIPAGTYDLTASRSGYLAMKFGGNAPGRAGVPIALRDQEDLRDLNILLPKASVIAGRVMNADGQPQSDVSVSAFAFQRRNGERVLGPGAPSMLSNSKGEYRLWGLPPGEYVVVATSAGNQSADIRRLTESMVDDAVRGAGQERGAGNPPTGFAPVFFPSTSDITLATVLRVGTGEELASIDITLRPVALARLTVSATPQVQGPVEQVRFWLAPRGPTMLGPGSRVGAKTAIGRPGDQHAFPGMAPGTYLVIAEGMRAKSNTGQSVVSLWASREILIDGSDSTLQLNLEPGGEISGEATIRENRAPNPARAGNRLFLEPLLRVFGQQFPRFEVSTDPSGLFSLQGIAPGDYRFVVVRSDAAVASGLHVTEVLSNSNDLLDGVVSIRPNSRLTGVSLTLSSLATEVRGSLLDASSLPTSEYSVVFFSQNRNDWYYQSRRIACVRPSTRGDFIVANLPPGPYLVIAVRDLSPDDCYDPDLLSSFSPTALQLTLSAGERKELNLKAAR